VALFESVGLVAQKAIRPAAAPMNASAVYYDRDDLNVSKRAPMSDAGSPDAETLARLISVLDTQDLARAIERPK
jgi:hypothetical protein